MKCIQLRAIFWTQLFPVVHTCLLRLAFANLEVLLASELHLTLQRRITSQFKLELGHPKAVLVQPSNGLFHHRFSVVEATLRASVVELVALTVLSFNYNRDLKLAEWVLVDGLR